MSLRDRIFELTTPEEVDEFLKEYPTAAFFKAGGCHKTMQGFGYVEQALSRRENLHMGIVRVIESRPASNHIADITGVKHESPQFILIKEGTVVYDVDNWDILPEILEHHLTQHFGEANGEEGTVGNAGNIEPYVNLLEKYLSDQISEHEFEMQWLTTFQMDDSLRSTQEFDLLNSLFGDVDEAINAKMGNGLDMAKQCHHKTLKFKAQQLLKQLEVLK